MQWKTAFLAGTPAPEIVWLKDGQPFNVDAHPDIRATNNNGELLF